jgi:serine protease Do
MQTTPHHPRTFWFLRLGLLTLIVATVLGSVYLTRHHSGGQYALAAGTGLSGPEIDLLDRQNKAYEQITQSIAPAVVYIRTEQVVRAEQSPMFNDPTFRQFFGQMFPQVPREQRQHALGTGVIFDSNGLIVTNNHVIDKATSMQVMLPDKRTFKAKLIGADPDIDIAVIKIDSTGLPTAPLGDSTTLHVGDIVMAFGNPFGLNFTVTRGAVSALGRSQGNIEALQDFIQTDAAINPGNSGGALVDVHGRVIGINTAILSAESGPGGEGGFIGIGFAIPINMAKRAVESLVKTGKVTRGFIGATIGPVTDELAQQFKAPDTSGALVQDVTPGGPSDKAGIKPGDVIRKLNGQTVNDSSSLLTMVAQTDPGSTINLDVLRNGQHENIKVTVEQRPANLAYTAGGRGGRGGGPGGRPQQQGALRGVAVQNLTADIRQQLGANAQVHGVVVTEVDQNAPAGQVVQQGDIIMAVNHQDVNSVTDFNRLASEAKGQTLLRIWRQGTAAFIVVPAADQSEQ